MSKHDIVPVNLVIKAMRDNGYRNTAYAIAELIDNSIQAGATQVELLCGQSRDMVRQRQRMQINQIGVLDNGSGMSPDVLRMALQFGNGTRLEDRSGIGRFGMGLPNSSISQARRVDVWSWQEGHDKAFHTYIDIDEISKAGLEEVPEPKLKPIPEIWKKVGKVFSNTGTLVVWSSIDLTMWSTAETIIENSQMLIGRIYRYYLQDQKVKIRMVSFDKDINPPKIQTDQLVKPNDPLYLMSNTSCPVPFDSNPMFEQWGEDVKHIVKFNGENHEVTIRFSYAKEEAREGHGPGERPYGKHAAKNVGVSVVRAERELELDPAWSNPSEPRDRWWGAEVRFPPALDELFGVTNNKQSARNFSELAKMDLDELIKDEQGWGAGRDRLEAEEDPRLPLFEIAQRVQKNLNTIRGLIKAQTASSNQANKRHQENSSPEAKATEVTRKRQEEGHQGVSDKQEQTPPEVRQQEITQELSDKGLAQNSAESLAALTVNRGLKYTFAAASLNSVPSFFDVTPKGGTLIITLNINHPAYEHLIELLEEDVNEAGIETLKQRLTRAKSGLKLLLTAWARYEDEQPDKQRTRVQDARWDWGRMARDFLDGDE